MSVASLAWFCLRVIPKPSRATYPCQQAAFPVAASIVLWLLGIKSGALRWLRRATQFRAVCVSGALALIALAAVTVADVTSGPNPRTWTPIDPPNTPMGVARGIKPGRVVWAQDPQATRWSGNKSDGTHWWDQASASQAKVDTVLSLSLRALTAANTDAMAWDQLFRYFNGRHGKGNRAYQMGELIAIKINQNTARSDHALNGNTKDQWSINGNPHLIKSLLSQLVNQAGVPQADITVYDASRCIGDNIYVPNHEAFPGVHFMDRDGGDGREKVIWSGTNVISYETNHMLGAELPVQVLNASYIINMAIMKNHGDGPTLTGKNHYGSIGRNGSAHQGDHKYIYMSGGANSYSTLVDLMGHKDLGEKTVLFMIDALYGAPGPDAVPTKWKMEPFNNWWPSSVFLSQDGVALDSVGFDFMNAEWGLAPNSDNYIKEAATADNPASGLIYAPNGDGVRLKSLGVYEHWNNATSKQYSRNLSGNGTGIELFPVPLGSMN